MPIRNPFARRPGPASVQDEDQRPGSAAGTTTDAAHPGFERVDTVGSKASSAFSIGSSRKSQDTGEYKMSVVNDSGVYLPPSPVEREPSWPRRYLSRTSSDRSSSLVPRSSASGSGEIEHFSISRESFDSYRRSFDISAKSPVIIPTTAITTRQSLDSSLRPPPFSAAAPPRFPRSSLSDQHARARCWEPPTPEESETGEAGEGIGGEGGDGDGTTRRMGEDAGRFEDVGLNGEENDDDFVRQQVQAPPPPPPAQGRKRGFFFGKFAGSSASDAGNAPTGPAEEGGTVVSRFLPGLGGGSGRKRAQSGGQGAELGVMPVAGGLDGAGAARLDEVQARGVEV